MANGFIDLEQNTNGEWVNLAPGAGGQGHSASPGGESPGGGSSSSSALVACNACQNGYPVGVGMFPPGQCPPHSSSSHANPCLSAGNTTTVTCYQCHPGGGVVGKSFQQSQCPSNWYPDANLSCGGNGNGNGTGTGNGTPPGMVSCSLCDGGSPMLNTFPDSCPGVWMPEYPLSDDRYADPCSDVDCWDCSTGGKQRVSADVPCAVSTAVRVAVKGNSSSNPCSGLGPSKDCWNCTTGAVTRINEGDPCPGNAGEAIYISDILANGSRDNPCKSFSNYCYKCTEGVVESQIFQSDIEAECPTDWTQDENPCPDFIDPQDEPVGTPVEPTTPPTEPTKAGFLGKNTKFITFGVILLGVLMLMKKPATQ